MSTRGRRARLERLETTNEPDHSCPAPGIAEAIVVEYYRLRELLSRYDFPKHLMMDKPDPAAEEEAARRLAECLRNVNCPPDYWVKQADTDRRLDAEPSLSGDALVQVAARLIVFEGSPDGATWRRMMDLSYRKRNPAEQSELDELHRRYPGMPLKHYDWMYEASRNVEEKVRELAASGLIDWTTPVESRWHSFADALWKRVQPYR
jgi:hypothetical protein